MTPLPKISSIVLFTLLCVSPANADRGKVQIFEKNDGKDSSNIDELSSHAQNVKNVQRASSVELQPPQGRLASIESTSPVGPPYPVTASWFMDRFKMEQWNQTILPFKAQGGDTIVLRAPPIIQRTKEELATDINFQWCGSYKSSSGNDGPMCYDQAVSDMAALGHNVSAFLSYQYEEGFTDDIMLCPKYDRKINGGRIYYRIVLPTKSVPESSEDPCEFAAGSDVIVLFTSFAGTDPHYLLLQSAQTFNVSVFFGLPAAPYNFQANLMPAYFAWVKRVLKEHKARFSKMRVLKSEQFIGKVANKKLHVQKSLYDTLVGYYSTDECNLADVQSVSTTTALYKQLGTLVKSFGKRLAISPSINLNRSQQNSSVAKHVQAFRHLAQTGVVNIIAVQEGRGVGKGSYYWPYQSNKPVAEIDPILDRIIHYLDPKLKVNVTFKEAYIASNQELFTAFQQARDELLATTSWQFDLWLNVEAFEYLRDDPCRPVDRMASGAGELMNRASKDRIDRALSVAGAKVQKVISFAWDSDYTCTTKKFSRSLHEEIMSDVNRPIIANCSFHSPHNLSVVVLGFNLEGETQGFRVEWTDTRGRQRVSQIHGYYFELDYGIEHHLVPSLEYVMLWDIPDMVMALAPIGTINVSASNAYEPCSFEYDLPYSQRN